MKKLLGLLFLATVAQAATISSNYDQMFLNANSERNYLLNSGAEKNDANVTDSSSIHSRSTSSPLIGVASHLIDGTGSSQNVDFQVTTLESGLLGTNCEALFLLNGDASLYTATVRINSSDVTTAQTLPNTGSYSQPVSIVFPCGVSGVSPVLRISSTSASAAAIKLDSIYFGRAVSLGTVNQIGDWQSYTPTRSETNNQTLGTNTYRRIGDSAQIIGRINWTGSGVAASTFTVTIPAGLSIDTAKISANSGSSIIGYFQWTDSGTNFRTGTVHYASATTYLFIVDSATSDFQSNAFASGDILTWQITVPILGWTTTSSYSLMNTYWKVDADIGGANPSLGTANVSSYTGIENGSLTLTNNSGTGTIAAQIGCSSTNAPSGTTCSAGNESVSVSFTPLGTFPQDVLACASFTHNGTTGATGTVESTFQIVETATNAQTILQEGKTRIASKMGVASSDNSAPFRLCGTFTFTSPGQKMLRLMYEQNVSATLSASVLLADQNASVGQRDIHWEVYPLSYNTPAPILVGGVTSANSTGGERSERAKLNCDSGSAITSQSGNWISSIGNISSGSCVVTLTTGMFSEAPACVASVDNINSGAIVAEQVRVTSATSVTVTYTFDTGSSVGAGTTYDFYLICQGAR